MQEQSHKSYRPLCVLTFRWNYLLHGLEPFGYHLVNVLLHCIASSIYFKYVTVVDFGGYINKHVSFLIAVCAPCFLARRWASQPPYYLLCIPSTRKLWLAWSVAPKHCRPYFFYRHSYFIVRRRTNPEPQVRLTLPKLPSKELVTSKIDDVYHGHPEWK